MLNKFMTYIYWNPPKEIFPFDLPLIGRPIVWYGLFFALGFFSCYQLFLLHLKDLGWEKKQREKFVEKLSSLIFIAILLGARLGDLLFYQNLAEYKGAPWQVLWQVLWKVFYFWEGGLASHGAVVAILLTLFLFARKNASISFYRLQDLLLAPAAIFAGFIRIGNFFNQEILGTVTACPWGVYFASPLDGSSPRVCHPVQLYESIFYFTLFFFFWRMRKVILQSEEGRLAGLFYLLLFGFRFFIEIFKETEPFYIYLSRGQLLSLPLLLFGLFLIRKPLINSFTSSSES